MAVAEEDDDDEIMSSSRSKHASRSRSRSNQSHRGTAVELSKNIKKRRYQEISQFEAPEENKGADRKDMLWVDKYAPRCLVRFLFS